MISRNFQERYAKYLLNEIEQEKYCNLKNGDRPDIISTDKSIGVEVTNALPQGWAELDSILGKYLGKGFNYMGILEETKMKNVSSHIFSLNAGENWGYHKDQDVISDFKNFIDEVKKMIKIKFMKIKKYDTCEQMELFIFLDLCCVTSQDIEKIWSDMIDDWIGFDTIIFYNYSKAFFLKRNGKIKREEVTEEMRKRASDSAIQEMELESRKMR